MKRIYRGTTTNYIRGNIVLPHPPRLKAPDGRDMRTWPEKTYGRVTPRYYLTGWLRDAEWYAAWEAIVTGGTPVVTVFHITPETARFIKPNSFEGENEYFVEVASWDSPLPFPASEVVPIRKSKLEDAYQQARNMLGDEPYFK